ncbi:MAG: hypothetical protein EXS42_09805 [Lacunisphaera sp.]|nr:hypothetical protein [Lacunisphaera sp.]
MQCQNGAYLSVFDAGLAEICLGPRKTPLAPLSDERPNTHVQTGQQLRDVLVRIGQAEFSDQVRANYNSTCVFPGCEITDPSFLIGAHIARWADNESMRGSTANGLCLCLMHDKAFEKGLFTIDSRYCVRVNSEACKDIKWASSHLNRFEGFSIKSGPILPSTEALATHWRRIKFTPGA